MQKIRINKKRFLDSLTLRIFFRAKIRRNCPLNYHRAIFFSVSFFIKRQIAYLAELIQCSNRPNQCPNPNEIYILLAVRCFYFLLLFRSLSYCINSTGAPQSSIKATIKPSDGELGSIITF